MFLIYCLKACQREREAGWGGAEVRADRQKSPLKEGERGEKDGEGDCPVTVRGGPIRGIAPQVLTAEIQNQSVKAMGSSSLV